MDKPQPLRSCREDIPKGFPEILKDLTKEILLAQPKTSREIYGVAAGKIQLIRNFHADVTLTLELQVTLGARCTGLVTGGETLW